MEQSFRANPSAGAITDLGAPGAVRGVYVQLLGLAVRDPAGAGATRDGELARISHHVLRGRVF